MSKFMQELEEKLRATKSDIIALKKAQENLEALIFTQEIFDKIKPQVQQKFILNNLSVFDLDDKTEELVKQLLTKQK